MAAASRVVIIEAIGPLSSPASVTVVPATSTLAAVAHAVRCASSAAFHVSSAVAIPGSSGVIAVSGPMMKSRAASTGVCTPKKPCGLNGPIAWSCAVPSL